MNLRDLSGAPGRIRTSGLLVRSQTLYPAELRAHDVVTISTVARQNDFWGHPPTFFSLFDPAILAQS